MSDNSYAGWTEEWMFSSNFNLKILIKMTNVFKFIIKTYIIVFGMITQGNLYISLM